MSSLRLSGDHTIAAQAIDPVAAGFTARNVRADAISAAQGTTDFGEYFLYFSFFLVVSALLLAYLFFAVGLEQRTTEVGILASIGFSPSKIRGVFLREGAILALAGSAIGAAAAVGYSALILYGLRTWWVGAVGTTDLTLHIAPEWLAAGAIGALTVGVAALWLGVRAMSRRSARALLKGDAAARSSQSATATKVAAGLLLIIGAGLLGAAMSEGGSHRRILRRRRRVAGRRVVCRIDLFAAAAIVGHAGARPAGLFALGIRHTSVRPARSVLSLALIAFASFVLVSVGAFKKEVSAAANDPRSGTGGFA